MTKDHPPAQALLNAAYESLHFSEGELFSAADVPEDLSLEQWIEKGEWLALANQVGAQSVFFVDNNPVVVFAKSNSDDLDVLRLFNKIWCMSRPILLFIARDGELAVYNLARPPIRSVEEWRSIRPLDVAQSAVEVTSRLQAYRREQIESGQLFEEKHFGKLDERADQSLIRDLRVVRNSLRTAGLDEEDLKYAHALIGRSIFIRYLEDRGVLTREYFEQVALKNANDAWLQLLDVELPRPMAAPLMENAVYHKILSNKEFTYALFDKLAEDFNGDMFPSDSKERRVVKQKHLTLLQGFLRGDVSAQQQLFFWAYRFDIIPVELISSIYEEFYHVEKSVSRTADTKGTHYTPPALVEFLLSHVLTPERLETNPRILDPACGSGIFLVEAFRRIVRFHVHKRNGERLSPAELREILRTQIAGIEINEEAARVAAFSLYLALLHYQEPRDILRQIEQGMNLPDLQYHADKTGNKFQYNILLTADTFRVRLNATEENYQLLFMEESTFPEFIDRQVDVVVGNPPWGATDISDYAIRWCTRRSLPVGDEELSQAFIWKALDLLREGGVAGLLVSTGIFFKHHPNSVEFRNKWLQSCKLIEVINFAHVRDVFFHAGIAPFASIIFEGSGAIPTETAAAQGWESPIEVDDHFVRYWSAKKTAQINSLQAVVLNESDLKKVRQGDLRRNDKLWKVYWWGNDRDRALIDWLELNTPLGDLSDKEGTRVTIGRGFEVTKRGTMPADWLGEYKHFPTENFVRYGPLDMSRLSSVPKKVYRRGTRDVYDGDRLLIKRGISQRSRVKGQIVARMENSSFCFLNSIHGVKLRNGQKWEYEILLGIFWSSLARYYYFLTSSAWGMWHYELHVEEIARMPIRFPSNKSLRNKITSVVDKLRRLSVPDKKAPKSKAKSANDSTIENLEKQLDNLIFELYELSEPERDQVNDMCAVGIEFFYNSENSRAAKPVEEREVVQGTLLDLLSDNRESEIDDYLEVFLEIWNHEVASANSEFSWRVIQPQDEWPLIAVVFSVYQKGETLANATVHDEDEWLEVLHKLNQNLLIPYDTDRVYIDGVIRAFTESDIIIIKRNERRLWTRSRAREDAAAILVQAMNMQESKQGVES